MLKQLLYKGKKIFDRGPNGIIKLVRANPKYLRDITEGTL